MNRLIETLWENALRVHPPQDEALESLRHKLFGQVTAAIGEDFTDKMAECCAQVEAASARAAFQTGFRLGGQLVLAVLTDDFTPV